MKNKTLTKCVTTRMGFEPTRAEHIGLAVQRLNHSATSSSNFCCLECTVMVAQKRNGVPFSCRGTKNGKGYSHAGN